jgi:PAS domain S-box-containing protein
MYRLYGMSPQQQPGNLELWRNSVHREDLGNVERALANSLKTGTAFDSEFRVLWADGSVHHIRAAGEVTRDAGGRALRMVGTNLDITEPRRLAESLAEQHERLRVTLHSIGDAVITTDALGNIDWLNAVAQDLTGWKPEEAVGMALQQVFRTEGGDRRIAGDAEGEGRQVHTLLLSRNGQRFDIEQSSACIRNAMGIPFGVVLVFRDITPRIRAEAELEQHRFHLEKLVDERTAALEIANEVAAAAHRASDQRMRAESEVKVQSSKLEAVGTLAAGIAHDFNNILASIVGLAEMTADDLPDGSIARRNVAQILSGSFRARDLVSHLLAFARVGPRAPVLVNIVSQVREALALLRASLRPSVELAFHGDTDDFSPTILADSTQIIQIVLNLCINAAYAMDNHGLISVSVDAAADIMDAPPGYPDGVCISVSDSGSGMTPEVMARIFDPFFTTKAPGEGSGLGLSVVYGIVKGLRGVIKVRSSSEAGSSGTEFRVFLPTASALQAI